MKKQIPAKQTITSIEGEVAITYPDKSESKKAVPVKEVIVEQPSILVGMSAALTKNLGNFESAKVSVTLTVPSTAFDLEDTYAFVKDWVNSKMSEAADSLK